MKETTIYISKENLLTNYDLLTEFAQTPVWPVLKANAYGHGIKQVTEILKNITAEYFIVQNYFEAEEIWKTLPNQKVLMLGTEPFINYQEMKFQNLTPVIGSLELLDYFCKTNEKISTHIKINTGMNRQGFDPSDIPQIISILEKNPQIIITGLMTHFSDSDSSDDTFTQKQYSCFEKCVSMFNSTGITPRWIHASNSAGLSKTSSNLTNAARAGIGLYGLNPLDPEDEKYEQYEQLKPILELHTYINHIRTIQSGESVGYGNTFVANSKTTIATIPIGYYEGIPRAMSNKGFCSNEQNTPLPIIGRVSMNLTSLNTTNSDMSIGDVIVVYSKNKLSPSTVTKNALHVGTIHYELTTNLKPHIPRIIV